MTTPRDTSKTDPALLLLDAMHKGSSKSITDMEKRGQTELVNSSVLPSEIPPADKVALEAKGLVFGEPVEGDPIFTNVTLPQGWKKERTEHDMWSILLDETGKEVASMFYKAAFYDRRAHMRLTKENAGG